MKLHLHLFLVAAAGLLATVTTVPAQAPGDVDPLNLVVAGGSVWVSAVQPDGKILLGGDFTSLQGSVRNNLARLNTDGTLDTSFKIAVWGDANFSSFVDCIAVQADGKVLIGGVFATLSQFDDAGNVIQQASRLNIARFNPDGTLDMGFDPEADRQVSRIAVQADGRVLLGGLFLTLQPNGASTATARSSLARLNVDGSLDTSFDVKANSFVNTIAVQTDGKIIVGGGFRTIQGTGAGTATARQYIARLNANGTLDTGFDPKASSNVWNLAVQTDGKILAAGDFSTLQPNGSVTPMTRQGIARLNADGTLDASFDAKANINYMDSVTVQSDGKIIFAGSFTTLQPNGAATPIPRQYMARLNADGSLDPDFDTKPDSPPKHLALLADGKVLASHGFNTTGLARLYNTASIQSLTCVPYGSSVYWMRSGGAPEVTQVTFEVQPDGGTTWTSLGAGTRQAGGWYRLGGFTLPFRGLVRARGRTSDGSGGIVEQVVFFSDPAEISVEGSAGTELTSGATTLDFALAAVGIAGAPKTLTIRNLGQQTLTLSVTTNGPQASDFTPTSSTAVLGGQTTTLTVTFTPLGTGTRTATLLIASNDADEGSFTVGLTGKGVPVAQDTDGDGMTDAAESQLAALGFDWQVAQPALVQAFKAAANASGLYTETQYNANRISGRNDVILFPNTYNLFTLSQVQNLNVDTPLLTRDTATGKFRLTLGLKKAATLTNFQPFSFTASGVTVNAAGELQFDFTVPDNAAFFRIEAK